MPAVGQYVHQLIGDQTAAWTYALEAARPLDARARYLFVGSGSSYYIGLAAAAVAQRAGLKARALPAADVCLEPAVALKDTDRVLIISRSGTTSEALWALGNARALSRPVTALTADPASELARAAEDVVASVVWEDHTVVMVRSYTGFLTYLEAAIAKAKAGLAGAHELPRLVPGFTEALRAGDVLTQAVGSTLPRRLIMLGAGVREGVALEGSLKVTEMSHVATSVFGPLEFRHGPRGAVTGDDWVVLLGQADFADEEGKVLEDLRAQTPHLAVIAREAWFTRAPRLPDMVPCVLPDTPGDWWNGPLAVVPLQRLAWHLAVLNGQDPDRPANLSKVVRLSRG
jgi:glucosamine--fructose-6-phosphate aminotransferase (isomerizing)